LGRVARFRRAVSALAFHTQSEPKRLRRGIKAFVDPVGVEARYAAQLRRRYPNSAEYLKLQQGQFE